MTGHGDGSLHNDLIYEREQDLTRLRKVRYAIVQAKYNNVTIYRQLYLLFEVLCFVFFYMFLNIDFFDAVAEAG